MESLSPLSVTSGQVDALAERLGGTADVKKLSEDFESLFVSMMLKTMRESMSKEMFAGDGSDTFGGLFDSFMGQHIAEQGGLGLTSLFKTNPLTDSTSPVAATLKAENPVGKIQNQLKAYENGIATGA